MRLFFYYTAMSVKNQIKKLCKSWFIIFLISCMLLGGIVGFGVGMFLENYEDPIGGADELPPDSEDAVIPEGDTEEIPELEFSTVLEIAEVAISVIFIFFMFFAVFGADKSGSAIFTLADVNLLFPSPMRPQSVLLFKLMTQILLSVFVSVYFLYQIPSLASVGFNTLSIVMIFIAWIMMLAYQKLINILIYTVCSTRPRVKGYLRPVTFAAVGALCLVCFLIFVNIGDPIQSCKVMFTSPATDYIPLYGWIKGLVISAAEGKIAVCLVYLILLLFGSAALAYFVWHLKADFFEEAMQKSEETAEKLEAMRGAAMAKKKKERPDKIRRDGFSHGSGADVFFHKTFYNRKRFSHLGFFTKTSELYLLIAVSMSLLMRFAFSYRGFVPLGLVLAAVAFFRALGNPLATDMSKDCFVTVPASAHEKVLWSLLSGSASCALDLLPAVLFGAVVLGASATHVIAFYLLAVSIDFYASNVMLFIEFSLPTSLALQVKQSISIIFIYFGLVPIAAVIAVGAILKMIGAFAFIGAALALGIGAIFFAFSPIFLAKGRK